MVYRLREEALTRNGYGETMTSMNFNLAHWGDHCGGATCLLTRFYCHGDHSTALLAVFALFILVLCSVVFLFRHWQWPAGYIIKGVNEDARKEAQRAAQARKHGKLPNLPFTEGNVTWVLLYDHVRVGQIDPSALRHMRREDLEYLAGMSFPHPDLIEPRRDRELDDKAATLRHEEATKLL